MKSTNKSKSGLAATAALTAVMAGVLAGCGSGAGEQVNIKPAYVGGITAGVYDGGNDDLLTAGLGKTGLGAPAPQPIDPLNPSAAELRRIAIYNNYRAILDISPAAATARFTARMWMREAM
jgi:hydroxybutyrate-dimer hydrolase